MKAHFVIGPVEWHMPDRCQGMGVYELYICAGAGQWGDRPHGNYKHDK